MFTEVILAYVLSFTVYRCKFPVGFTAPFTILLPSARGETLDLHLVPLDGAALQGLVVSDDAVEGIVVEASVLVMLNEIYIKLCIYLQGPIIKENIA